MPLCEAPSNMSHGGDYNWFNALSITSTHSISNNDYGFARSNILLILLSKILTPLHESNIFYIAYPEGTGSTRAV